MRYTGGRAVEVPLRNGIEIAAANIVDGATRLYGIIGDPIAQVGSPRAFTQRFHAAGRNAILIPLHVLPARFDETVRGAMALGNLSYRRRADTSDGALVYLRHAPSIRRWTAWRLRRNSGN